MLDSSPVKIIEYVRDGLVEQSHNGLFVKLSKNGQVFRVGNDNNYPYFLRSCAKPLQASLLIDFGIDKELTTEELAICCASHAGEPCHVEVVRKLLNKFDLNEHFLKCGLHKPLSKTEQNKLIASGEKENILQNNCSGKHTMMLIICKKMGYSLDAYNDINHPLQIAIKNKIYELCECESEYPITKDGCGVPIHSMPLENMLKGYLNLFLADKYKKIKEAYLQYPYLIGGEDKLDTALMEVNKNLVSKLGAGGLCAVVNLQKKEALIIKIMDSDMKARDIAFIDALIQLEWLDENMLENPLIKARNNKDILTLHGEKVGEIKSCFKFS